MWRDMYADAPADALFFPSENGTPMRPENWLRRHLKPHAAKLKITVPVNFQVLRRTFATNAQEFGDVKSVQSHLRHTDIATTLGVYTQPIDANVRRLVNAVTADVMASKPETDSEKTPSQLNTQPWGPNR
jgi:site-specific recombinase XerD